MCGCHATERLRIRSKSPQNPPLAGFSVGVAKPKKDNSAQSEPDRPVSLDRHRRTCTICSHEKRAEIEADFVDWKSPALITEEFGLGDRTTVYRHAHALGAIANVVAQCFGSGASKQAYGSLL
jgi:hypothetical protein